LTQNKPDDAVVYPGHERGVRTLVWSPDGTRLALADEDGRLFVRDVANGAIRSAWNVGHRVFHLAWTKESTRLFTAGWSVQDNSRVYSGGWSQDVTVWDPVDGRRLAAYPTRFDAVYDFGLSPSERRLAVAGEEAENTEGSAVVQVFDTTTDATLLIYSEHTGSWTSGVAWSPSGDLIASTGYNDRSVRVWHAESGKTIATAVIAGDRKDTYSVAWAPDGVRIAVGSKRGITIYCAATGEQLAEMEDGHTWRVAWSPDGALLGAQFSWGLSLYEAATYALVYEYEANGLTTPGQETAFDWSPDGARIATTDVHGTIQVWAPPNRPSQS
jgi:WD40 repeat protein